MELPGSKRGRSARKATGSPEIQRRATYSVNYTYYNFFTLEKEMDPFLFILLLVDIKKSGAQESHSVAMQCAFLLIFFPLGNIVNSKSGSFCDLQRSLMLIC